jgi:hypothetical protein
MNSVLKSAGVCLLIAVLVAGCASTAKGPSDQEVIQGTLAKMKSALETKNVDMLMECLSENFEHPEVGGKAEAKEMAQMGVDAGYADDGECSLDDVQITINPDGATATAYPVDLSGAPGSIAVEVVLAKENGQWLVTTVNPDGV